MSEVKLKPCPFCGGEAVASKTFEHKLPYIECLKCHAAMLSPNANGAPALAEKWNTRVTDWQVINTAPCNTPVLVFWNESVGNCAATASKIDDEWISVGYGLISPTNWMQLPPPPEHSQ